MRPWHLQTWLCETLALQTWCIRRTGRAAPAAPSLLDQPLCAESWAGRPAARAAVPSPPCKAPSLVWYALELACHGHRLPWAGPGRAEPPAGIAPDLHPALQLYGHGGWAGRGISGAISPSWRQGPQRRVTRTVEPPIKGSTGQSRCMSGPYPLIVPTDHLNQGPNQPARI